MTIDDESSVYVGGLPYNVSEDSLRDLFAMYGSIVAVKVRFAPLGFSLHFQGFSQFLVTWSGGCRGDDCTESDGCF